MAEGLLAGTVYKLSIIVITALFAGANIGGMTNKCFFKLHDPWSAAVSIL